MARYKVLVTDDEEPLREGIKGLIDWQACGFEICDDASDGLEALAKMRQLNPDVLLLDVRMPVCDGLTAAKMARDSGYEGAILFLTGHSDFEYARAAISCGASGYLLKPIDELELIDAMNRIRAALDKKYYSGSGSYSVHKALLADILKGVSQYQEDMRQSGLELKESEKYQVAILSADDSAKALPEQVKRLIPGRNVEILNIADQVVLLLKGEKAISSLPQLAQDLERHLNPLSGKGGLFAACGRVVQGHAELAKSYADAKSIFKKRFFCGESQQLVTYELLQMASDIKEAEAELDFETICNEILGYVETGNEEAVNLLMGRLYDELRFISKSPENIRGLLSNLYLSVKKELMEKYPEIDFGFPTNEEIVREISSQQQLYRILQYTKAGLQQGVKQMLSQGSISMRLCQYARHNYKNNLKLENLAGLYGYNSAYLGKVFKNETGESFHSYLDRLRIQKAQELLLGEMKTYKIALAVGFTDIDTFYKKFRQCTGLSPGEFRSSAGKSEIL